MHNPSSNMHVETATLKNGITVVTHAMPHLESTALGVWVRSGSRYEQKCQHGISHLLEHMAFKGTKSRSARNIAEEIEATGGDLNAATSVENTCYYARVLKQGVPLAIDILSDILINTRFDEIELLREKNVILQEIGACLDNPDDAIFDRFQETAYQNQAIGRAILGTEGSIRELSSADLKYFFYTQYQPKDIVIAAAGALEHDQFVHTIEKSFGGMEASCTPKLTPTPAQYIGGYYCQSKQMMESYIIMGFEGYSYSHKHYYAAQLLANILGGGMASRLFQEIREKLGLCYSIFAFHWGFSDTGLFGVQAATSRDNLTKLLSEISNNILSLCEYITNKELERAKAQLRAGLLMVLENPVARSSQLAHQILAFKRTIDLRELIEYIDTITPQDLCKLANSIFINTKITSAVIGPQLSSLDIKKLLCEYKIA